MEIVRESIVVSSLRSFAKTCFGVFGIVFALFIVFVISSFFSSSQIVFPEKVMPVIRPDAHGNRDLLPSNAPVLLEICITDEIGTHQLTSEKIEELLLSSREGIFKNDRVKGIFLRIDTPGGSAFDSGAIYRLIRNYKEQYKVPVIAFVEQLCASGGMYIACSADEIHAAPGSIIGSVGVITPPAFNVSQFLDQHGVQSLTLTQGKDKDVLNPFRPWKPGEADNLTNLLAASYNDFIEVVSSNRPLLTPAKLREQYGANVYDGRRAKEYGYIDVADSSYAAALSELATRANLDKTEYQVFELRSPTSMFKDIIEAKSSLLHGKLQHSLNLSSSETESKYPALFLYHPTSCN